MVRATRLLRLSVAGAAMILLSACTELIVREGRPRASIIVPKSAPIEVSRAAKELQAYVLKTSGAELPIRADDAPRTEAVEIRLAVSPLGITPGGDPSTQLVHLDGYTIESHGRMITIMGASPRGTLYGVYDFIERALGVRWFMPTELGEDILEKQTIEVPELSVVKNPAFPIVSGFTWAGSPGAAEWEQRMRARIGKRDSFGHNWYNIHRYSKETFAKNPEMFAMVGGRRGSSTQLCTSNPEVVKVTVETARRYFQANPESPLFSISPNDGNGWCECDRCRKIDALYGITDESLADRFVHYANEVLVELEKTNPGKQVGILAYVDHTVPPKKAKPRADYATLLTHMPWAFCHVHSIDDPSCPSNREYLRYLKGWMALTKHVGVYDYYGHFFAFTPWPIVHSIRRDIPLFHSLGVERFTSETQQNWANQGLNFYVAVRLANDPKVDVDALLAEYFTRFYGKAAAPMRRYFDLWEDAMVNDTAAAGDRGYAWLSIFTPARTAEAGALLQEAEALAKGDREKVRKRVAFARTGFGYTEAYTNMLDAGLRKDPDAVMKWVEEAVKRLKATEGSAPQAFFVSLAVDHTRYIGKNILAQGVAPWVALRPIPLPSPPTTP
jgi:hypothetical protein